MNKSRKITVIIASIASGFVVTYFGVSLIATAIINHNYFEIRGSTPKELDDNSFFFLQKTQKDFDNLQKRTYLSIPYEDMNLQGYLYHQENPKGLIVSCHGINSLADSDHAQYQSYYFDKGYDVFSFDMVGCGNSDGDSMTGLYESRYCVDSAISFISNYETTKDLPIFLIGHSWGGYGSVASTFDSKNVKAVVSFGGFEQAVEEMAGMASNYVGGLVNFLKPGLDTSMAIYKGKKAFVNASEAIKENPNVSYYIVQGKNDNTVHYKDSLYHAVENKNYPNVTLKLLENHTNND